MSTIIKSNNPVIDMLREMRNQHSEVMEYANSLDDVEIQELVNVHCPFTRQELLDRIDAMDIATIRKVYFASGLNEARDEH